MHAMIIVEKEIWICDLGDQILYLLFQCNI